MKILFIGDIVGSPGRKIVHDRLADIITQRSIDLCIANGENSASGFGITPRLAEEIFAAGAEVITGGNHIWNRKEIIEFFPHEPRLMRPANFPNRLAGKRPLRRSSEERRRLRSDESARTHVHGASRRSLPHRRTRTGAMPPDVKVIIVDMHAEATSEKQAMGWHLDGKVSAVLGTHTHVATADNRVLPGGTAYITDVGMTGPHDSVIGMEKKPIVQRFLDALPAKFAVAEGDVQMNTVQIDVDEATGRARSIDRLNFRLD